MARRTTPAANGKKPRKSAMSAPVMEPTEPEAPRRSRKPKLHEIVDAVVPVADEPVVTAASDEPPAKPRRGRKPKELAADPLPSMTEEPEAPHLAEPAPAEPVASEPPAKPARGRKPKPAPEPAAEAVPAGHEPSPPVEVSDAGTPASPAAHWDAATGGVTFDWPAIERVAAQGGPNQGMAKLLLAARAEGATSRWPF